MSTVPHLDELAVIAAVAVGVALVLAKLRLPTVAGLLVAGTLVGPSALNWVTSVHTIEVLAEVGVVLLLFTIGLEFSLARLRLIFRDAALGGVFQVAGTTLATMGIALWLGQTTPRAMLYGFVFALSSTAIVLRGLAERQELEAPHGRMIVGTLIFQDLCVVPMVLIVPLLASGADAGSMSLSVGLALLKAAAMVLAVVLLSRTLVPRVLGWVDASRSGEMFLLAVLGLCIGTAWLTSLAGLSLALGAFLGGMVVADTQFGHRAMADILPLRNIFVSLFFVSMGMLFDPLVVMEHPGTVGFLLAGFLVFKGFLATLAALLIRFPPRVAWLSGVGLAQFGEFGFVLIKLAQSNGLVTADEMKPLLAAGILSMFLTPILVRIAPQIRAGEQALAPLARLMGLHTTELDGITRPPVHTPSRAHVIVIGYGLAGRAVAQSLAAQRIPCIVLELNAETVRDAQARDLPVEYADATSPEALRHAGIEWASAVVVLINDAQAVERILVACRRASASVPVFTRVRYADQADWLLGLGATDVIVEEVEGALEMTVRLLRRLEVPRNDIEDQVEIIRAQSGGQRRMTMPRQSLGEHAALSDLKIESVRIHADSAALDQTAVGMHLRNRTGALMVAVRRGDRLLEQPDPNLPFDEGDIVYLVGASSAVRAAVHLLEHGDLPNDSGEHPAALTGPMSAIRPR